MVEVDPFFDVPPRRTLGSPHRSPTLGLMRTLLVSLLTLVSFTTLSSISHAQIIAVHFKTEKAAKKFSKNTVLYNGELVLMGEPKSGFVYDEAKATLSYMPDGTNVLFVVDPDKPEEPAYYYIDGEKEETSKKNKLNVQGKYVDRLTLVMRDQSLPGLTHEYLIRSEQMEAFREARDATEKGTVPWLAAHRRLVTALERMHSWLENVGFPGAIKSLEKDLKGELKAVRDESLRARFETALASVAVCEVPEEFAELSTEISGGKDVFHGYESQHIRLYYLNATGRSDQGVITDAQAKHLLEKGEEIIEGFRAEFVDPFLDEDYPDYIPDKLCVTFAFFPDDPDIFQSYAGPLYGRQESPSTRDIKGGGNIGDQPVHQRFFWRLDNTDIEGIICHGLGHVIAAKHYGQGRNDLRQDWLQEAVGNQLSYEYLGRNNVTCLGLREKPTYEKPKTADPGEKVTAFGRRVTYNKLALEHGAPINLIALKKLFELADGDLAKGWSFYDFIARKEGKAGQMWLRAAGQHVLERDSFIENWRLAAAKILGVDAGDAFRALEDRWRTYAESDQLKDDGKKKR